MNTDSQTPKAGSKITLTEQTKALFDPARGDLILSTMRQYVHSNPFVIGLTYILVSLGGIFLFAALGGVLRAHPALPKPKYLALLQDYGNIIVFLVVIPLGIVLLFRYYRSLRLGIFQLLEEQIIRFKNDGDREDFLSILDLRINRLWYFALAFLLSFSLNLWIAVNLTGTWNSFHATKIPGGDALLGLLAAAWFRIFAVINFTLLFYVLIKGVVMLRMMKHIFDQEFLLQPLHPDRCSGLLPLGRTSSNLNLFLALVTFYLTILVVVDGIPLTHPLFLGAVLIFIALATTLFLTPLLYSHAKMHQQQQDVLRVLNDDFQEHFQKLTQIAQEHAELPNDVIHRMETLEKLSQMAQKMPTWPLNLQTLGRFFAVGGGPALVAVAKLFFGSPTPAKTTKLPDAIERKLPPSLRKFLKRKPPTKPQKTTPPKGKAKATPTSRPLPR